MKGHKIWKSDLPIDGINYFYSIIISPLFLLIPPLFIVWFTVINYRRARTLGITNKISAFLISVLMFVLLIFPIWSIGVIIQEVQFSSSWYVHLFSIISLIPFLIFTLRKSKEVEKEPEYENEDVIFSHEDFYSSKDNQDNKADNISELAADLKKLNELKEKGILTEQEFNEQKKKLLKQ